MGGVTTNPWSPSWGESRDVGSGSRVEDEDRNNTEQGRVPEWACGGKTNPTDETGTCDGRLEGN